MHIDVYIRCRKRFRLLFSKIKNKLKEKKIKRHHWNLPAFLFRSFYLLGILEVASLLYVHCFHYPSLVLRRDRAFQQQPFLPLIFRFLSRGNGERKWQKKEAIASHITDSNLNYYWSRWATTRDGEVLFVGWKHQSHERSHQNRWKQAAEEGCVAAMATDLQVGGLQGLGETRYRGGHSIECFERGRKKRSEGDEQSGGGREFSWSQPFSLALKNKIDDYIIYSVLITPRKHVCTSSTCTVW